MTLSSHPITLIENFRGLAALLPQPLVELPGILEGGPSWQKGELRAKRELLFGHEAELPEPFFGARRWLPTPHGRRPTWRPICWRTALRVSFGSMVMPSMAEVATTS